MSLRQQRPYQGYAYAYPHKTAYRPLEPAPSLAEVWRDEPRDALYLYLHVPFCEMRCGFCNLFTAVERDGSVHARYLDAVARQAEVVADALGPSTFARAAIGGGTPTILEPDELARAFDVVEDALSTDLSAVPLSVETSPATALPERLAVLRERGASRISIGVQSFVEAEVHASGRPQRSDEVEGALDAIRARGFDVLNLDLIYGHPGQTVASWRHSLDRALAWDPEELFLYPLYVRPKTGLERVGRSWDDERLELYRVGRDHLLERGYRQLSMRLFRRADVPEAATGYRCQADGMVGLGAGARSYTERVHYSTEWGVGRQRVRGILEDFVERGDDRHGRAEVGIVLDRDERARRHVLQSLLCRPGLERSFYRERFGSEPLDDLPMLAELLEDGLAADDGETVALTDDGLERSDAIGPWLASDAVRERMRGFDLR